MLPPRGYELPRHLVARAGARAGARRAAYLHPCAWRWQGVLAWAVNSAFLMSATFWLLFILTSRELVNPAHLYAGALDDSQWRDEFLESLLLQCFYSFVLVDGVKIACLTLTSGSILDGVLPSKTEWPVAHQAVRKPLRRMHKALDMLL